MSKAGPEKELSVGRLRELLARSRALRADQITGEGLTPGQRMLAQWQADRLARTYEDFKRQERYAAAVEFFLTDLYGPADFSGRDDNVERVFPLMAKVLSRHALHSIALGVELHALSQELDTAMVRILSEELGVTGELDAELYGEAYRRCDAYPARLHQIQLVRELGDTLDEVVRKPLIYTAVRVARKPAHAAGLGDLQDFVERGLRAFRQMKGADEFLNAIVKRETRVLEAIRDAEPVAAWADGVAA